MYDLMGIDMVKEYVCERMRGLKKDLNVGMKVLYGSYCSKNKRGKGEFDWDKGFNKYIVGDIYLGFRWDFIREEVRHRGLNVNDIWVFSGKYGMVNWNKEIEWYDVYMGIDKLEDGKRIVREWCKGMIDRYGVFKMVYWVENSIWKKSKQYVEVMKVIEEYGCKLEIKEIW